MSLDTTDTDLLELLQEDCSRSLAELGKRVGLSVSAVNGRLQKLRSRGDVRAFVALINPQSIGYTTCAFIQVVLSGPKSDQAFIAAILKMPEVQECHRTAGEFPYLLKIWARDLQHLQQLVDGRIKACSGVIRVQTLVVLSSPKDQVTGLNPQ